ncbi:MAG: hypothetical protein R2909_10085 [Gemmatimonadales bacterium]
MSAPRLVPALAALALVGSPGAAPEPAPVRHCATIMESSVCAWVVSRAGQAVELHASVPLALIRNVSPHAPMTWPPAELGAVPLGPEARAAFGLERLGINWEAHGHPPATFLTPHFDFHFYSVTAQEVDAIDCADLTKPASIPEGFALPDIEIPEMGTLVGLCVPKMGMHALPSSDLAATDPFGVSPLIGYYRGRPVFVEPMVAQARLLAKEGFTLSIPPVAHLPAGVRYPRSIRGEFDSARDELHLVLSDFSAAPNGGARTGR